MRDLSIIRLVVVICALALTAGCVPEVWANSGTEEQLETYPAPMGGMEALTKNLQIPEGALDDGESAKVLLSVIISEKGEVTAVEVLQSASAALDSTAIQGVRKTKWTPAMKHGAPVECQVVVPVQFKMGKKGDK